MADSDLNRIMEDADINKDGTIDYHEFLAATINMGKLDRDENLVKAFEHFDEDGNGKISREELTKALKGLQMTNIDEILKEVDQNGDGEIDYKEFCTMMRNL
jgi:calcium-dependent protein kinase